MSIVATPSGAEPQYGTSFNGSMSGRTTPFKIASGYDTAIFKGDFVKIVGAGTVELDAGTTTATPIGVFMGVDYTDPNTNQFLSDVQWKADTVASDAVAHVVTDPNVVMQMQADGAIAQTALGSNFAIIQTAGSTTIGRSKNAVDASTSATTNTLPLRLLGFVDGPESEVGDAFTDVLMTFNVGHQLKNTTGV